MDAFLHVLTIIGWALLGLGALGALVWVLAVIVLAVVFRRGFDE